MKNLKKNDAAPKSEAGGDEKQLCFLWGLKLQDWPGIYKCRLQFLNLLSFEWCLLNIVKWPICGH